MYICPSWNWSVSYKIYIIDTSLSLSQAIHIYTSSLYRTTRGDRLTLKSTKTGPTTIILDTQIREQILENGLTIVQLIRLGLNYKTKPTEMDPYQAIEYVQDHSLYQEKIKKLAQYAREHAALSDYIERNGGNCDDILSDM